MALSSPVLLVALRAPSQLGPEGDADTGPHIARVSVLLTPQPAEPFGRAEPSVKRKSAGSSNRGSQEVPWTWPCSLPGRESFYVS